MFLEETASTSRLIVAAPRRVTLAILVGGWLMSVETHQNAGGEEKADHSAFGRIDGKLEKICCHDTCYTTNDE